MVIKRLGIKGFGRLEEFEIRLTGGINVIYGENESGKTTIQWFIKGMFYGLEGGREREDGSKPPLKRFEPWDGSQYGGFLEYVLDDGSSYTVNRDFNRNTVRIMDSSFNDITHTFEVGKDRKIKFAEEHLGLNETCFEKTVFIKQMETRIDSSGRQEILNRLINAQETGYEDVSFKAAEKALLDAIKTCTGTGRSTTRPLDKIAERLGMLKEKLGELKKKRERFSEVEAYIKKTKMMIIKNKREMDILNVSGELIKTARELLRLKKIKGDNRMAAKNIKCMKNTKRYLDAGIIAACLAAIALVLVERIIEMYSLAVGFQLPVAARVFLVLILGLVVPGILLLARRRVINNQRELEKKLGVESIKNDIEGTRAKLVSLVKRLEEEGQLKYPWVFSLLAAEEGEADIESILNEEEKTWMMAFERARDEEMNLALKLKEYETIAASMDYDDEEIQEAAEEIEELETRKKNLEEIRFSLNKALEVLQESRIEMQRDFLPLLNERMGYYLCSITEGRYRDIRADDRLVIKIMGPENIDVVNASQLSSGTVDQVYIALRLALADLITSRGERLPFIMDEVFSQFDDTRTRETVKILDNLSWDRQVVLFTCKKREVEMISEICGKVNIIELTGV